MSYADKILFWYPRVIVVSPPLFSLVHVFRTSSLSDGIPKPTLCKSQIISRILVLHTTLRNSKKLCFHVILNSTFSESDLFIGLMVSIQKGKKAPRQSFQNFKSYARKLKLSIQDWYLQSSKCFFGDSCYLFGTLRS